MIKQKIYVKLKTSRAQRKVNNISMKIVFMGTPQFAAAVLAKLAESGCEIGYAVSQPDRAKNRGKKLLPTPVKEEADKRGIAVLQPEKIKGNDEFLNTLKEYEPDLIAVAAYGKILPKEILELPRFGCINVHGSLLPRHRGAAPVQRAIMEGDEKTGVTLMYMAEGLDTGDMIAKAETKVGRKTTGELLEELAAIGGELLVAKLPEIAGGNITREKQDDSQATYADMLSKEDGRIDFEDTPEKIERLIRGTAPWPGAYTYFNGEMLKIWAAEPLDTKTDAPSGTVVDAGKSGIDIAAGGRVLRVLELQAPGKRRMSADDYLRGNKFEKGIRLGE